MKKLAPLLALYFSQGLPFGFQALALPLLLRERGASLQAIGFSGMLAAPWLVKALWAPLVDRYGNARFGRRKSWIVPMQALLAATALLAARADDPNQLYQLIFAMNLFAATQDIAVDALAVSWLRASELGPGNAVQVIGYKLGMLTGGGLLAWASGSIGWSGVFYAMAALLGLVLAIAIGMHEPSDAAAESGEPGDAAAESGEPGLASATRPGPPDFARVAARLRDALREPAALALVAVVVTYKMGESLADAMWKPMLFDRGFSSADIGLWSGTFGMICSLAGTSLAGLLVRRHALVPTLVWVAAVRALGVVAQFWLSSLEQPSASAVIAVTCLEDLFGGAITTVVFALMMRHTDPEIGGTHYTLLASLEVWGKLPLRALSGVIAAGLGYPALFGAASALCVAFVALTLWLRPRLALGAGQGTILANAA